MTIVLFETQAISRVHERLARTAEVRIQLVVNVLETKQRSGN